MNNIFDKIQKYGKKNLQRPFVLKIKLKKSRKI